MINPKGESSVDLSELGRREERNKEEVMVATDCALINARIASWAGASTLT